MSDSEQSAPTESEQLQEIFVSVTGETSVTLSQDSGPGRGVIDAAPHGSPPHLEQVPDSAAPGGLDGPGGTDPG